MKISLASDLHLEFEAVTLENTDNTEVLVLAGDICLAEELERFPEDAVIVQDNQRKMSGKAQRYRDFFKDVSNKWQYVLYVAGNHEFYHGKFNASLDILANEACKYKNVIFMEDSYVNIDYVRFLGATLWTNMDNMNAVSMQVAQYAMNDYRIIKNDRGVENYSRLQPKDTVERHVRSLQYLNQEAAKEAPGQVVVVSHMAPSFLSVHEMYKDEPTNGAYASDLSETILDNPNITHWFHGHMHMPADYTIGNCRVVANPKGYPGQLPDWKLKTVEI